MKDRSQAVRHLNEMGGVRTTAAGFHLNKKKEPRGKSKSGGYYTLLTERGPAMVKLISYMQLFHMEQAGAASLQLGPFHIWLFIFTVIIPF